MTADPDTIWLRLERACATSGPEAMLEMLAESLRKRRRWHALVDARLLQARLALGLQPTGDLGPLSPADRDRFDERSLAACREAGWPLLDEGQIATAWIYLRAAAEPADVAARLAARAASLLGAGADADEDVRRQVHEIVGVALWEGVDPALGIDIILQTEGMCPAITAFDQAVARLPAARQRPAAARLVDRLAAEIAARLAADLGGRGVAVGPAPHALGRLLDAAVSEPGLAIACDTSHLHSVLRIARVCTDEAAVSGAWDLARYACRLPADVRYPGAAPFTDMGEASRLFYGAQLGHDVEEAVAFFRRAADAADHDGSGPLPGEVLTLLLSRIGRPADALDAALGRPPDPGMHGESLPPGALPAVVDLAAAAGDFSRLRTACRERGDEITFAATLVSEIYQGRGQPHRGPQAPQPSPHAVS